MWQAGCHGCSGTHLQRPPLQGRVHEQKAAVTCMACWVACMEYAHLWCALERVGKGQLTPCTEVMEHQGHSAAGHGAWASKGAIQAQGSRR